MCFFCHLNFEIWYSLCLFHNIFKKTYIPFVIFWRVFFFQSSGKILTKFASFCLIYRWIFCFISIFQEAYFFFTIIQWYFGAFFTNFWWKCMFFWSFNKIVNFFLWSINETFFRMYLQKVRFFCNAQLNAKHCSYQCQNINFMDLIIKKQTYTNLKGGGGGFFVKQI